ncbi:heavy metal-responsive transcriptional regulator [Ralstonia pickettii]|uniref:heavy metal-responsive transcriptional regulator n=1 Tax=Ralstonia pickettii TaxID=329 RepID=UPI001F1B444A|nr:heavy metal-responsive transcriptional regulator [Ralstonia pickettii]
MQTKTVPIGETPVRTPSHPKNQRGSGVGQTSPRESRPVAPSHPSDWLGEAAEKRAAMTIGKLAKLANVSPDTIRFYEDENLLTPTSKTAAGYRLYGEDAARRLDFIKHAQHCGMTLSEIRQLLELKADDSSCCSDVRSLAIRKKLQLEQQVKAMQAMSRALSKLIAICTAEDRPLDDCPILAALESSLADQRRGSTLTPGNR